MEARGSVFDSHTPDHIIPHVGIQIMDKYNDYWEFIISYAIDTIEVSEQEIADKFSVSLPTIQRWREGMSSPHPLAQKHIVNFIKNKNGEFNRKHGCK